MANNCYNLGGGRKKYSLKELSRESRGKKVILYILQVRESAEDRGTGRGEHRVPGSQEVLEPPQPGQGPNQCGGGGSDSARAVYSAPGGDQSWSA